MFLFQILISEKIFPIFIDRVLSEIEQIDPDVILFGGDIVHETSYDQVIEHTKIFSQLVKIAPTMWFTVIMI